MQKKTHRYAVIMAGGTGTRLWPLSRKARPKQFHTLVSKRTFLEETFERVLKLVPKDHIFISTTEQYRDAVLKILPSLQKNHIIIEPAPRGTAPAITLAAQTLFALDPKSIVATLHSDHAIEGTEKFVESITTAFKAVERSPERITVVGINPIFPSTELGYIHMGKELDPIEKTRIFLVDSFREKPNLPTAKKYLADWAYLWNAGYFIFSAHFFLDHANAVMPAITRGIKTFFFSKEKKENRNALYASIPNEVIDKALIEKLNPEQRMVVPSEMEWADIGTWDTLFDFLRKTNHENCIVTGNHIDIESKNCFIRGNKRLIATVGLKDTVIIDTDDALLVAKKGSTKKVKEIIEIMKEKGEERYL